MKRFFLALFVFGAIGAHAQKSGSAARIAAITSLEEYKLNPQLKDKLEYALENIDIACNDQKTSDDPVTWRNKGEIYSMVALDDQLSTKFKKAASDAYIAFEKSLSMEESKAEVKGKTKDKIAGKAMFIDGFNQTVKALYRQGSFAFNEQNYELCYDMYSKLIQIPARTADFDTKKKIELTFESGKETVDMANNAAFLGGIAAVKIGKMEEAEKMLRPLMAEKKIKDEDIKSCYKVLSSGYFEKGQAEKAKAIVAEGRKQFPGDFDMLITEINIALQEGKLAELEGQLKQAVEADPTNVMLHFIMGNMYDELFRGKVNYEKWPVADDDLKQGTEFFNKAVEWYKSALKIDGKHFNSAYSLGAIYVNFSNYFATLNKNSDKLKKEERAAIEKEYFKYVDQGLEFLLAAEKIEPNDISLVRGLKEVYSRKSDDDNWSKYSAKEKELLKKGN
jgi:tetratricopeptide (TPR) repeat protein